jgi:hypothetical protein
MAETAKKGARPKVEAVPEPDPTPGRAATTGAPAEQEPRGHATTACPVAFCPICLAVSAVQPIKPDVVEHLLRAGSEFFLAFRALLDARADEMAGRHDDETTHLEKIDIG